MKGTAAPAPAARVLVGLVLAIPLLGDGGGFTDAYRFKAWALLVGATLLLSGPVGRLARGEGVGPSLSAAAAAGLAFHLLPLVSVAWAADRHAALDAGLGRLGLAVAFGVAWSLGDRLPVRWFLRALVAGAVGTAVVAFWPSTAGRPVEASATLGNPTFAATYLAAALPAALVLRLVPRSGLDGWLGGVGLVALVGHLVATDSRAGWVAGAVGLAVAAVGVARGRRAAGQAIVGRIEKLGLVAAGLGLAALLAMHAPAGDRLASIVDPDHPTNRVRLLIWGSTARALAGRPATGFGAGNFAGAYAGVRTVEEAHLHPGEIDVVGQPHNVLLEVLSEVGPVGLAVLALVLGGCLRGLAGRSSDAGSWALAGVVAAVGVDGLATGVLDNPAAGLAASVAAAALLPRGDRVWRPPLDAARRPIALGLVGLAALAVVVDGRWLLADHRLASVGRGGAGRRVLHSAEELAPGDYRIPLELGRRLLEAGEADAAVEVTRRALAIRPDLDNAADRLARALWQGAGPGDDARREEALAEWDRSIERAPWSARNRANRGRALERLGRPAEAARDYLAAFENRSRPVWSDAFLVCRSLRAAGHRSLAAAWLGRALDLGPPAEEVARLRGDPDFRSLFELLRMRDP